MAAVMLTGGTRARPTPSPTLWLYPPQPMGGFRGQASVIDIHAREILNRKAKLNQRLSDCTAQPIERSSRDTDGDYFLAAEEGHEATALAAPRAEAV